MSVCRQALFIFRYTMYVFLGSFFLFGYIKVCMPAWQAVPIRNGCLMKGRMAVIKCRCILAIDSLHVNTSIHSPQLSAEEKCKKQLKSQIPVWDIIVFLNNESLK